MATQNDLEKAFEGIKPEDVSVKADGRIEIKKPEIAARVAKVAAGELRANDACQNFGCGPSGSNKGCTNTQCQ
jgi:hypothetical protein